MGCVPPSWGAMAARLLVRSCIAATTRHAQSAASTAEWRPLASDTLPGVWLLLQILFQTRAGVEASIQDDGTPFASTRVDAQRK